MTQKEIDFTGAELALKGMQQAIDHADSVSEKWSERAYQLLIKFLKENKRFMAEDLRSYAALVDFELPPHPRAWGGVVVRASNNRLIISINTKPVKNPKAHCANANYWERNDERMIENGLI